MHTYIHTYIYTCTHTHLQAAHPPPAAGPKLSGTFREGGRTREPREMQAIVPVVLVYI